MGIKRNILTSILTIIRRLDFIKTEIYGLYQKGNFKKHFIKFENKNRIFCKKIIRNCRTYFVWQGIL